VIQATNFASLSQSRKATLQIKRKKETKRKRETRKALKLTMMILKVANSVGMKTKTSTNKTIKRIKKTIKKVLIRQITKMTQPPLKKILNGREKIKRAEGKISGT
jgi:hypothetical protein